MAKIEKAAIRYHAKASEKYIDVCFNYTGCSLHTSIPLEYRRTGTAIADADIDSYLEKVYAQIHPDHWHDWRAEQIQFWKDKPKAAVTKGFYDVLERDFSWCCAVCMLPPNPNPQRRIQDLKEFGYTLATDTNKYCRQCGKHTTHIILVPLARGGITGYETWSPQARQYIISVLGSDAVEGKHTKKESLLPDHKFPEIRWDAGTRRASLENLASEEIKRDFQLMTNQRNQQKREVCRQCFQTGRRGVFSGIPFFYQGGAFWDETIPKTGKAAEQGCIGCAWYDIERWRQELIKRLERSALSEGSR